MNMNFINIGYGNIVSTDKIVSIVNPESAPIKRMIAEAREKGILIDATHGRKTRGVIITNSNHVVLSAVQPETMVHRLVYKEQTSIQGEGNE